MQRITSLRLAPRTLDDYDFGQIGCAIADTGG